MINNIPQLIDIISKSKEVTVYGAGKVGISIVDFLYHNYSIEKIKAVLVSKQDGQPENIYSIPVWQVDKSLLDRENLVIVATKCNLHDEIIEVLDQCGFTNIDTVDDSLCDILMRKYDINHHNHPDYFMELKQVQDSIIRMTPQPRLRYVVLNILDHCNLNCKGCDHFAPLAKERCVPYETIERDVRRFSELMEQEVDIIGIMGGEPLLHPQLLDIIKIVRKCFPKTRIQVDTNGLLLLRQQDEFWKIMKDNRIVIVNTKYPINLEHEKLERVCYEKDVWFEYYGDTGETEKKLYKICMDTEGGQDSRSSFSKCFHANNCVTLMEGKLFPCTIAPNVHIFNEHYNTTMELCKEDYIDIHNYGIRKKEILEFLSKPIPFCRFCDVEHRNYGYDWCTSKKERSEWTLTEREKYPGEENRIKTPRSELKYEVHLTEHCNLNCKGCFHFSSIADKEFLDVSEYEKDCKRLSELFDGRAQQILLLGGEPLLHPQVNDLIKITRENFPIGEIVIVTNGLLLPGIDEAFWSCCRENNIVIEPTKYPISLDYEKLNTIADKHKVKMKYFNNGNVEKTLSFQPIDLQGIQPKEENFYGCYRANNCITLKHGKLFTCIMPAHIHHFAKYFNESLPDFEDDGIDIYQAESAAEICQFLTKPINACCYCDRAHVKDGFKWEHSRKQKEEWVMI